MNDLPVHLAYQAYKTMTAADPNTSKVAVGDFPFTPADIPGPYFLEGSPPRADLGPPGAGTGNLITLTGVAQGKGGMPLAGCKLDFWLADPQGVYSGFADQGTQGQDFCRGHVVTDEEGRYEVKFARPGRYKISDTEERTPHVHLKAKPAAGPELTTQLYFPDEEAANVKDGWEPKHDPMLLMVKTSETEFGFDLTLKTFH